MSKARTQRVARMGRPSRTDDREPLTIVLPVALKKWLRIRAAEEDRNQSDVIVDALAAYKKGLRKK